MELLWNQLTKKNKQTRKPYFLFLLLNTLLWLLPMGIAAAVICSMLALPTADLVRYTALVAGYPGLVVGFFGGLLYLMRDQ
ncbi:MAG: hypothetical protein LUE92_17470 [Clostridiales bacterium]|nr:hypothetical protein [Clostridiales bacterium]